MERPYLRLLLGGTLIAGCVFGPGTVEQPRLTIRSAELLRTEADRASLRLVGSAYNPNPFPVSLRQAAIELDVDGLRVAQSLEPVSRTLPPRRPVAIEIVQPVFLRETNTRTKSALVRTLARYRVRGYVDVGARDRVFDVPFRHEGMLRGPPSATTF